MMKARILSAAAILCAAATVFAAADEVLPPALRELAETERAFARAARAKGIRDSFLEFFAEDAIAFRPDAASARAGLLKQPSTPFSVNELVWEPRTGDVAASADLGWLTGPSTFIDHSADKAPHYGNYLSVWRKQADGRWRVFIDVGVGLPSEATFAPGFTRMPFAARYTGAEGKDAAGQRLLAADRQLNAKIAADGPSRAYAPVVGEGTRLHRAGSLPPVGPQAIGAWLDRNASGLSATSTKAEAAASGDLGYSYGKYQVGGGRPEAGAYVRVWTRDAAGRWLVVADVTQRTPPPRP